ncbi:MAG TPA: beta-galactosidase GalB [Polyangiaceae bacterium]|nr:beta-galactosidase GalB [Polyangiaceae bacterium]
MFHVTFGASVTVASITLACTTASPEAASPQATSSAASSEGPLQHVARAAARERLSLDAGWRFYEYPSAQAADDLIYDVRPEVADPQRERAADDRPTEAARVQTTRPVLAPWILPTANPFIADPAQRHARPPGNPGGDFAFVQASFDDAAWERVELPHDWAIRGPFFTAAKAEVGGGMGRLPSPGVAWYRRVLDVPATDAGRSLFLEVDGAMSYAMVWLNGNLVGGWPYGYSSWQLDLTPFVVPGGENQLAIRLDNPPSSSRWYPGGGLYRHVWLTKTHRVHVGQWGSSVTTRDVSTQAATVDLALTIDNDSARDATVEARTELYALDERGARTGAPVARLEAQTAAIGARQSSTLRGSVTLARPRLWGPPPGQVPHRYVAVTTLRSGGELIDEYSTRFGIRSLRFDPEQGVFVNGQRVYLQGANQHHDLGALGAAFNTRAAERQLELLREMGCNAIRMAHNPPAPELLELTDRMGFLVIDESFDAWALKKPPLDFHLVFPAWHEADLRALVRRDRNHPSVMAWSIGNEVGEQYTGDEGAALARRLHDIVRSEDATRPTTASMNYAKPEMPLPEITDLISLNYQGEGIRDTPGYAHLKGIRTSPLYPAFHQAFPDKLILSSENAAAVSSRGTYLFPVTREDSAPAEDGRGGDPNRRQVSSYELYTAAFGSSADKVLASLERHPYVAGGFVWSGWDYLGEPTPYPLSRSSYFGVIDLAGFKKDRFYLYQSAWRPDFPMVHVLPHWTWPERVGQVTPVHVFTSGDEAELWLNGRSLGRKKKGSHEQRLRWDDVRYEPGELKVVAYRGGKPWAEESVQTAGEPAALVAAVDRAEIAADGRDLAFVTLRVADESGRTVPRADALIRFRVDGPGEIVATDNGDATDFTPFPSRERRAFNGLCLVILRGTPGSTGSIVLHAESNSLAAATLTLHGVTPSP